MQEKHFDILLVLDHRSLKNRSLLNTLNSFCVILDSHI